MKSVEAIAGMAAETIRRMFGPPLGEIPHVARPLIDLKLQTRGSQWGLPTVVADYRGINYFGLPAKSPKSREWLQVPRDHSRPRHRH